MREPNCLTSGEAAFSWASLPSWTSVIPPCAAFIRKSLSEIWFECVGADEAVCDVSWPGVEASLGVFVADVGAESVEVVEGVLSNEPVKSFELDWLIVFGWLLGVPVIALFPAVLSSTFVS